MHRAAKTMTGEDLEAFEHRAIRRRRQIAEGVSHEALEAADTVGHQVLKTVDVVFVE